MGYRDLPEGPITGLGEVGPGFYQTRGRGNKSGRVSPRQQVRGSARDLTFAQHGLVDQGLANPNQGQLFDTGPRPSNASVIEERGLNMPTGIHWEKRTSKGSQSVDLRYGAAPGFMPNLNSKQKIRALESVHEGRIEAGTDTGRGTPIRDVMESRAEVRGRVGNQEWYQGVDPETGRHSSTAGQAHEAIARRAENLGVSHGAMTRATAITSPQSAWDLGKPGSPDYKMPNLTHAAGVVEATEYAKSGGLSREDAVQIGSEIPTTDGGLGTRGAKAAGVHYDKGHDVRSPLKVMAHQSQKAPNFEASLRLSDPSNVVRGMAAESYTVDRHDARAAGIAGKALENRTGVYDALAMTGARTAFKNRELPPNEQAREWVGAREAPPVNSPQNAMFEWSNNKKRYEPKKGLVHSNPAAPKSRVQRRGMGRDIASDLIWSSNV